MKIKIVKGDITKVQADGIVNAANNYLSRGGGVCGAIYSAAGIQLAKCTTNMMQRLYGNEPVATGSAHLTPAFDINTAAYIVHAVGPVYNPELGDELMEVLLEDAYKNSLGHAINRDMHSIAFPAISTGIYGFPMGKALKVVKKVLETTRYDGKIILTCFSKEDYKAYKREIKPWKIYLKRTFGK